MPPLQIRIDRLKGRLANLKLQSRLRRPIEEQLKLLVLKQLNAENRQDRKAA